VVICISFLSDGENFLQWTFQSNSAVTKAWKLSFKRLYVIGFLLFVFSGVQDFIPCCNLDIVSETFAQDCFKCTHFICFRSEHEMQQVESVSQNNTVSAVFVHVRMCVCSCVFAYGNTCTCRYRCGEGMRFEVPTEMLPRIKLV
jgi:hypothetical protein